MSFFTKKMDFNLNYLGGDAPDGVFIPVVMTLQDDGRIEIKVSMPDDDAIDYLNELGGDGVVNHWIKAVANHLSNPVKAGDFLSNNITDKEYDKLFN